MSSRRPLKYRNGPRCVDFGVGQGASAAPISAAISAKRATPASAKSEATLRARGFGPSGRVARSVQPATGMRLTRFLPSAPSASTRDPFRYLNSLLSGPDLSEDSAEVPAEDQLDVCIRIAPANQTISDVKHTLIMIHAIGVHLIAESVTGFVEAP